MELDTIVLTTEIPFDRIWDVPPVVLAMSTLCSHGEKPL